MKQIIWSSYDLLDEKAKEYYQNSQREILDDDSYEVSDEEWAEEVYRWLDDERSNQIKKWTALLSCSATWDYGKAGDKAIKYWAAPLPIF